MRKLLKDKRGSEDVFLVVIFLFIAAVFLLFAFYLNSQITATASPVFESLVSGSSAPMTAVSSIFTGTINYVFLALFFGLLVSLLITSFMTPTHPVFFILSIILFIGLIVVSVILSNSYETIANLPQFATADSVLSIPHFIMGHLPMISLAVGILAAIIIYSRSNMGFGGGTAQVQ